MTTLITQIEAILNFRPPTEYPPIQMIYVLSPGDFLLDQPLVALPFSDLTSTPVNRLTRWELIRQCTQSFWNRWSVEYLLSLQRRTKCESR